MNKKQLAFFIVMLLCGIPMSFGRNEEVINMQHIGHHNDHSKYYPLADMPEVYFDSNDFDLKSSWAHLFPSINQPINN
jgi:hypothetical protein